MYTNRKLLANQQAAEREKFYCEKAYEYTLRADSAAQILNHYKALLGELKKAHADYRFFQENTMTISVSGAAFYSIKIAAEESGCVRFVLYFDQWKVYMLKEPIFYGKEMNLVFTAFEKLLCEIDPYTWLREIPTDRKCKQPMARPEEWETVGYHSLAPSEEIRKQNLKDCYLADVLRSMGIDVRGGSEAPAAGENPLLKKKRSEIVESQVKNEEAEAKEKQERLAENERRTAAGQISLEEEEANKAREKEELRRKFPTVDEYPFLFLANSAEPSHPYIFANINEDKTLCLEPEDGEVLRIRMTGLSVSMRKKGEKQFTKAISDPACGDYVLYVTDDRIAVINPKYNKDRSAGWIGIGDLSTMMIASALTYAERGIRAVLRQEKAHAGHIRYEWIVSIGYDHKVKFLDNETLRITYKDHQNTVWLVDLYVNTKDADAETLANMILKKAARIRASMTDEKDQDSADFNADVLGGKKIIAKSDDPSKLSMISFPDFYFASYGAQYRNMKYLEAYEEQRQMSEQSQVDKEGQNANQPAENNVQPSGGNDKKPEKKLNFCPACGTKVIPDAKFCSKCGNKLI